MKRPEHCLPIDVVGSLTLQSPDGVDLCVVAEEDQLVAVVDALPGLFRLRRQFKPGWKQHIGELLRALRLGDLDVALHFRGRQVARLGPTTRGTWTARLLGLAPAEVRLSAILSGMVLRR